MIEGCPCGKKTISVSCCVVVNRAAARRDSSHKAGYSISL